MRFVARGVSIFALMATVALGAGCSKAGKPEQRSESDLRVLKLRPDARLEQTSASFYAKNGEAREVALYFADSAGGRGSLYFRLRVGPNTLRARPDGTPIAPGDSVLVTVKVEDSNAMLFDLQPSGLRFDKAQPAELLIAYAEASRDFDGDGDQDKEDQAIERRLGIWRQEVVRGPFERLPSRVDEKLGQVSAPLDGFTRYAISY